MEVFLIVGTCMSIQMQRKCRFSSMAQNSYVTWCVARTAWASSHHQTPRQWRRQWAAWWWTSSGGRRWPCPGWPRRTPSPRADLKRVTPKNQSPSVTLELQRLVSYWGNDTMRGKTISVPANIIMCWKFPLILCLLPRLRRKDSG